MRVTGKFTVLVSDFTEQKQAKTYNYFLYRKQQKVMKTISAHKKVLT
jgi:hypothetical protein